MADAEATEADAAVETVIAVDAVAEIEIEDHASAVVEIEIVVDAAAVTEIEALDERSPQLPTQPLKPQHLPPTPSQKRIAAMMTATPDSVPDGDLF